MRPAFSAQVLSKYQADYVVCDACGFLCSREPHWLEEAYSSAIATADTGLVTRNISLSGKVASALYLAIGERGNGQYLDTAGGYGMFTRLMRDTGFNFHWTDKYCENLLARGFEYRPELGPCHAVTALEVLEHLTDPVSFVAETLDFAQSDTLVFTTELYTGKPPDPNAWWYYSFATGQHIGFFQRRTLETLAARMGLKFASANGLHVLSKNPVNELALKLATGRLITRITPRWIRWHLGSKTLSDHRLMLRCLV
jgi:hypothetical protein